MGYSRAFKANASGAHGRGGRGGRGELRPGSTKGDLTRGDLIRGDLTQRDYIDYIENKTGARASGRSNYFISEDRTGAGIEMTEGYPNRSDRGVP